MKLKRLTAVCISVIMLLSAASLCAFGSWAELKEEKSSFEKGVGPEIDGYAIDYRYFSPVKDNDSTKYPVVIWLHGMGNGWQEGDQLTVSDISVWARADYQSRFKESGGAFIITPRSHEEKGVFWGDSHIRPLRGLIDDFIAKHKDNVDLTRIYIGGYSMGGKMTLKMAVAYPELFAAVFPICPKWIPDTASAKKIADIPVWLTSSVTDPLVNYFSEIMPTWENIISESNVAELCRFSTLTKAVFPDGSTAFTLHDSWFSVNYDMFSSENGDYPGMSTVNGKGDEVKLTYPDGMISWLSGFRSDYDGSPATDGGNSEAYKANGVWNIFMTVINFFRNLIRYFFK